MALGGSIPLAFDDKGKYYTPMDVKSPFYTPRVLKCPSCLTEVVPRVNGKIRIPHFAHKSFHQCQGGEGIIHKSAKEMVASRIHDYTFVNTCGSCGAIKKHIFQNVTCKVEMIMGKFIIDVGVMKPSGDKYGAIEIHHTHPIGEKKGSYLSKMLNDRVFEIEAHDVLEGKTILYSKLKCSLCNPYKGTILYKTRYTSNISRMNAIMEDSRDRELFVRQKFKPCDKSMLLGTAGSGKTTLIQQMIKNNRDKKFLFTCFNKSLKDEITERFWGEELTNVTVFTFDSIWRKMYATYIRGGDFRPDWSFEYKEELDEYLNGYSDINSFKPQVSKWIKEVLKDETWWTFKRMQRDIYDSNGTFIKTFISRYDVLICDEAQDMQPMTFRIIDEMFNKYVHVVYAGDPCQQLYAFTGAIDSMTRIVPDQIFTLHKTFRFGEDACRFLNNSGVNRYFTFSGVNDKTTPVIRYSEFSDHKKVSYTFIFRSVCCMIQQAEEIALGGTRVSLDFDKRIDEIKREKKLMDVYKRQGREIYLDNKTQVWIETLTDSKIEQLKELFSSVKPVDDEIYVEFSTVHKYKGMEAEIVRVFDDVFEDDDLNIINVAISRAKGLLVIP